MDLEKCPGDCETRVGGPHTSVPRIARFDNRGTRTSDENSNSGRASSGSGRPSRDSRRQDGQAHPQRTRHLHQVHHTGAVRIRMHNKLAALVALGKYLGMFDERPQNSNVIYAISDEPMSAEEWKKQYVKEG